MYVVSYHIVNLMMFIFIVHYTCQLSRLGVENFDLTPAHACGPISHAWLKNVSCCCLAWHNFQKYVNSDPCKERKPCVKWINDNTFLAISDFVDKCFLDNFGLLRKTSDFFGNLRKWLCRLQKSQYSQDKNLTLVSQKKLAGIVHNSNRVSTNGRGTLMFYFVLS